MATCKLYGKLFTALADKTIDLNSDTIKCALVTSSYVFDQDAHDFFNDITNEVVGTGYTAGGATLASPSFSYTGASNVFAFDAGDASWASSTLTARGAVVYDATPGSSATNPLIAFIDFGADVSSTNSTFAIQWDAAGIFTVTVSS